MENLTYSGLDDDEWDDTVSDSYGYDNSDYGDGARSQRDIIRLEQEYLMGQMTRWHVQKYTWFRFTFAQDNPCRM